MRGTAILVAITLGLVPGCGLDASGLGGGIDGGLLIDGAAATTSPPDATLPDANTPQSEDASADAAEAASVDSPSPEDGATSGDAAGEDASCPFPAPDASIAAVTKIAPAPTIDGNLSDWGCTSWTLLDDTNAAYVVANGQTISGEYAVRWDATSIYVAAHILVPTLQGTNTTDPYDNDAIEIYLTGDMPPTGDYDPQSHQYIVDWHNTAVDYGPVNYPPSRASTNPPHFTSAVKVVSDGWQIEAAIGWQALLKSGPGLASGNALAVDVAFDDGDGTELQTQLVAMLAPHSITCGCTSCCCGEVNPNPDMPNCDTLCFGPVTLQ